MVAGPYDGIVVTGVRASARVDDHTAELVLISTDSEARRDANWSAQFLFPQCFTVEVKSADCNEKRCLRDPGKVE